MDKFSELKRLAEKCPVQRFEPFIGRAGGRGTQAIFNADTKGEVITWSGFDSSDVTSRTGREAIARFVAAVDPETVLALLAELEAKDDALRAIAFHVSAGGYNADSVDAEMFKQKIIDGINGISDVLVKRLAELESANKSQDDHINQQQDRIDSLEKKNGDLGRSLGAAEKRLATPVRLPERYSIDCGVCADPNGEWISHNDVIATLFTAGFTVEGDE